MPFPHQFGQVLSDPVEMSQALQANFRQAYTKGETYAKSEVYSKAESDLAYLGPHAGMYAGGSQAITENTVTQITGFTKAFQTQAGMVDTTNHRIVIPRSGLYRASGQVSYVPAGVNIQEMIAYLLLNGSQIGANGRSALAGPVTQLGPQVSRLYPMVAGDLVTLSTYWYAAVGGTYATSGGSTVFLDVEWVGPTPTA